MTRYNAPHEAREAGKLESLVESFRTGKTVPAIVVVEDTEDAITGSHRIAAFEIARQRYEVGQAGYNVQPTLNVVEVDREEVNAAVEELGDNHYCQTEYGDLCRALYELTESDEVRAALADQMTGR